MTNEDKELEIYIQQTLQVYNVPHSDELKNEILSEFQHTKIQKSNISVSLKDIFQNKTLIFILASIAATIFLIYLFSVLFPSEDKNTNSNTNTNSNQSQTIINDTGVVSKNITTSVSDSSNVHTKSQDSLNNNIPKNTISSVPENKISSENIKKDSAQISHSQKIITTDTSAAKPKKKKKKKIKDNNSTEDNPLPVLEPQAPKLNSNSKEEE